MAIAETDTESTHRSSGTKDVAADTLTARALLGPFGSTPPPSRGVRGTIPSTTSWREAAGAFYEASARTLSRTKGIGIWPPRRGGGGDMKRMNLARRSTSVVGPQLRAPAPNPGPDLASYPLGRCLAMPRCWCARAHRGPQPALSTPADERATACSDTDTTSARLSSPARRPAAIHVRNLIRRFVGSV